MFLRFADRPSDSPYIERVWRARSDGGGPFVSVAAGHLELVVTQLADFTMVTVRGPETRATTIDCPPDGEWAAIRFRLGVHMPSLPTGLLLDHRDVHLPVSADGTFELHGLRWPLPDLENAERYVDQLARRGVIARDQVVEAAVRGVRQSLAIRSVQRHFRRTTGLTHGRFRQVERARHATNLLRDGASILDTVHEAGYFDQAHLTRSLKVLIGETPASVTRHHTQLSFLYKTSRPAPG
jgi:helix-turn-helix protein